MPKNMTGILIETTIKKTLRQIKDDPERSIRNAIDMALNFTNGRFQEHFLTAAQTMLKNEQSCYYKLIPDLVSHLDEKRIITFGMNIGYNSCTLGAQKIREIEAQEQYNVPWSVSLEVDGNEYLKNKSAYHLLIEQGMQMGIYTWMLHPRGKLRPVLELATHFPDCAFPIFCLPEEISPALLNDTNDIPNILFVVRYSEGIESTCDLLRSRNMLYSISVPVTVLDISSLDMENILCDAENMHSVFTVFTGTERYSAKQRSEFYQFILKIRTEQKYRTIPFDMIGDTLFIDSIISDEACSIGFTKKGDCYLLNDQAQQIYNFFHHKLSEILSAVTPKKNI